MRTHIRANTRKGGSMVKANMFGLVETLMKANFLRAANMEEEYGHHLSGKFTTAATNWTRRRGVVSTHGPTAVSLKANFRLTRSNSYFI